MGQLLSIVEGMGAGAWMSLGLLILSFLLKAGTVRSSVVIVAVGGIGCGGSSGGGGGGGTRGGGAPEIISMEVTPATTRIAEGGSPAPFSARFVWSDGSRSDATVTWETSNPAVATITPGGIATPEGWGMAVLTATCTEYTGSAMLIVEGPAIYAADNGKLKVHPWGGGTPMTFDLNVGWGFAPVMNGVCYIGRLSPPGPVPDDTPALGIWRSDLVNPPVLLGALPPVSQTRGMIADSKGRLYILADGPDKGLLRFNTVTNQFMAPADLPGQVATAFAMSDDDTLYIQDNMPAGTWVFKVSVGGDVMGPMSAAAECPAAYGDAYGSGIAVTGDRKVLYIADENLSFAGSGDARTGYIYRGEDPLRTGTFSMPVPCTDQFPPSVHGPLFGILWVEDGLLINGSILRDGNSDGFFSGDEQTPGIYAYAPSNLHILMAKSVPWRP